MEIQNDHKVLDGERKYEGWRFEDYAEFLDVVKQDMTPAEREAWPRHELGSRGTDRPQWYGTKSWEKALNYAQNGWSYGTRKLDRELEAMAPYVLGALPVASETLAPAGFYPNVPAFCAGTPAHMVCPGDDFTARTPVLRFLINIGGLSNVKGDSWFKRGAALVSVIDYFEQTGMRCEIELVSIAQAHVSLCEVNIPLKRATEPLDIERFAFALCNPSMLRRFVFSLREKSSTVARQLSGHGYGGTIDAQAEPDQVYIPKMRNYSSPESALKDVLTRVSEFLEPELQARVREDWSAILPQDSRVA